MFRVAEIKNAHRRGPNAKKHRDIPLEELQARHPEERTAPYFSVVPEQLDKDDRLNSLSTPDRGLFLLLCTKMWRRGGMVDNFPAGLANSMGLTLEVWNLFEKRVRDAGLLVVSTDKLSLLQPELREQFLQFLERG
jgi:hypothetical protein